MLQKLLKKVALQRHHPHRALNRNSDLKTRTGSQDGSHVYIAHSNGIALAASGWRNDGCLYELVLR